MCVGEWKECEKQVSFLRGKVVLVLRGVTMYVSLVGPSEALSPLMSGGGT